MTVETKSREATDNLDSSIGKNGFHTEELQTKTKSIQPSDNPEMGNLTDTNDSIETNKTNADKSKRTKSKEKQNLNKEGKDRKKKKLISLSILKDIRFFTFLLALFFNSLPSSNLFLPSLAVSRGLTEFEAAYLLSINAGTDTVFRVIAGLVLDFKIFRNKRPIIYNAMTFVQATTVVLIPSMTSFVSFAVLVSVEGVAQGIKNAQVSILSMLTIVLWNGIENAMPCTIISHRNHLDIRLKPPLQEVCWRCFFTVYFVIYVSRLVLE